MSDYTVNDVVKAALEKDMIGLKAAVGDQLGSRAQEAIAAMYPEVGASMSDPDPDYGNEEDAELEAEADEIMSDMEELEIDDSEEETDEDV